MSLPPNSGDGILARTMRGAGWVVAWRMMTRVLGMASTLVLVRLLAPADFGLVALATAFAMALDVCLSIGVDDQIVRAQSPTRALYDTAFTLNLMRCVAVAGLVALAAAPAADFFTDARLQGVLLALALSVLAAGVTNIGVVDFRRQLRFEKEFQLQLMPRLLGIGMTIGGALLLRSYWALVLGIFANRAGNVVMSYVMHPFRPRLTLAAWRELAAVSCWSWATSVATVIRDRVDSLVIGRILGPMPVGIYAVGVEVAILPSTEVVDPICRACMPGFAASLRGEGGSEVGDAYLRIVTLIALLTLPAGLGISLMAGPVVALGFGQDWLGAVPVVTVLGVACMLTLFGSVSSAMLNARAMLRTLFGVSLFAAGMRLVLLLACIPLWGLPGAAVAIGMAVVVEHLVLVGYALRLMHLSPLRLLACIARPALAAATMAGVLWFSGLGWATPPGNAALAAGQLLGGVGLGVVSYAGALLSFWAIAGCPAGAERDMLRLLQRLGGRLLAAGRLGVLRGG